MGLGEGIKPLGQGVSVWGGGCVGGCGLPYDYVRGVCGCVCVEGWG